MPWEEILAMPAFWYSAAIFGSVAAVCATIVAIAAIASITYIACSLSNIISRELAHMWRERAKRRAYSMTPRVEATGD